MNRTDRLYALVDELRGAAPRARSARWLAERFEVSTRTVERDLLALQQAGVPIWATPGPGGGYSLDRAMTLPPLNFTASEATATAIALASGRPMPFAGAARSALRKILAAMTASGRDEARELAGRIHLPVASGEAVPARPEVLRTVESAISERRVLSIDYVDRSGAATMGRLVEPAVLMLGREHWYLFGWCRLREAGRAFRLDRIGAAELVGERAEPRPLAEVAACVMDWVHALSLE